MSCLWRSNPFNELIHYSWSLGYVLQASGDAKWADTISDRQLAKYSRPEEQEKRCFQRLEQSLSSLLGCAPTDRLAGRRHVVA